MSAKPTAEKILIKNIHDLIGNVKKGLIVDYKKFYREIELAEQRYFDNLVRLEEEE